MNSFWASFFDQLRTCGRSATWFLVTLGLSFAFLLITAWALQNGHSDSIVAALVTAVVFFAILLAVSIRRAILWRRERCKLSKLSDDELTKARARLARRGKLSAYPSATRPQRVRPTPGEVY